MKLNHFFTSIFIVFTVCLFIAGILMICQYNTPQNEATSAAQKAVASFLQQPIDSIACTSMAGGLDEATIVKCSTQKNDYIVKVFSDTKSGMHETAWTRLACDLGIGPKLYYADPAGSYLIIEFVKGTSLLPITANNPATIKKIAQSVSRLHHASAPFAELSDMVTRIDAKYKKLHSSGKLQELLETTYNVVKRLETELQKTTVLPTPCHNDLNPRNIFINHDAVTIIDWGDAALGNPFYDIAAFFILNAIEPDNEQLFFETYDAKLLASKWQEYTQACKQMVRFEFALNLLLGVQENDKELLHSLELPQIKNLRHHLTLFAKQEVATDSTFLYHMALASLHEITRNHTMMNVTICKTKAISDQQIIDCLDANYGIKVATLTFIPLGADIDASVYKAQTYDQSSYFVKLKRGYLDDIGVIIQLMLHDAGIKQIISPIKTNHGKSTHHIADFTLMVYPFIEGEDGFSRDLTNDQWITLGKALRRIHEFRLPPLIQDRIKRESYSPQWRKALRSIYNHIDTEPDVADETALKLLMFMKEHRGTIQRLVNRAEQLAQKIQTKSPEFVLCHSDIHGGNVLITNDGNLYIVDWDQPIIAPKERDLMFIGGGIANVWNNQHEEEFFYKGYGKTKINKEILSYYRHERIVEDIALYSQQLLLTTDGGKDREIMYKQFIAIFEPRGVVDIAFKTDTESMI